MITSTMKIERYYSSLKEESTPLSDDAAALLEAEDYVGFFKACGPNYTRGIRRAQEVTAIFKFTTSSREKATQFSSSLKVSATGVGVDASFAAKSKYKEVTSNLVIKIIGFGLGLNQEGSETMVATSLAEYNEVMKFSFNTMTKNEDAHNIGMVYGIEVVPWVHNSAFQAAAKLQEENLLLPLPRSLIPKAYKTSDGTTTGFVNDSSTRAQFTCKDPSFEIDKYGYCCETDSLFDLDAGEFNADDATARVCRPFRSLDKTLLKDNMSNNGEFVARLDSAIRYRLVQLGQVEKCISAANAIPEKFEFNILKAQDTVKYDRAIETSMTVFELKRALDPLGDFNLISHLTKELDEWIEMYYSPCMAALYGTNLATTPDTDVSFFMAYPWHFHKECMRLSCLSVNMRWDRDNGGCIPGIITGSASSSDYGTDETHCAKDGDKMESADEECKHDRTTLSTYQQDAKTCWNSSTLLQGGQIDYFIAHFCNPQITGAKATDAERQALIDNAVANCQYTV